MTMHHDRILDALNPAQRDAVTTLRGPLLVLAGAGTGKTRVVTCRIARLIQSGTAPGRILAVTFTNKAAREMRERLGSMLPRSGRPEISTFHALCVRILRRQIHRLGFPNHFAIYDRSEQESVARQVLRELRLATASLRPDELLYFIGQWKNRCVRPPQAAGLAASDKEHLAASGYRRYQQALRHAGALDFDDLLLWTEDLLARHDEALQQERARFDHLLIDEYQDTNPSQYRIARALALAHRNLCVVGDDDQSIYAWRGADVRHILSFQRDWPDAKVIRLEQNYRSTQAILVLANRLIRFNAHRHEKTLVAATPGGQRPRVVQYRDEQDEARQTVRDIESQLRAGRSPREIAILFRTNEQPRSFEAELRRAGIPYTLIGSASFYDRREVKDILAYLRVLESPHDELALRRILNVPRRGIGPASAEGLLRAATSQGVSLWQVLATSPASAGKAAPAARGLVGLVEQYRRRMEPGRMAETLRQLVGAIGYQAEIERNYDDPVERQARWGSVEQLVSALAEYEQESPQPGLREFLDQSLLDDRSFDRDKEKKLARDAVALLTLHSAKGLEFPCVYMVGMEEGILPHHRSLRDNGTDVDEERRLCYVGVTRAREQLCLSLALARRKWGKLRPTHPSRFLFELTGTAQRPVRTKERR